jgi:hypothetical protein
MSRDFVCIDNAQYLLFRVSKRATKEAMFCCKKVRHIAYNERSVYLICFLERAAYVKFATLLTDSQGLY